MQVEITIPILNEEETLDAQIRKVVTYLATELADMPDIAVVIADNGSSDKSQQIAQSLVQEFSQVKYLRLNERGVGRALKASWGKSQADIVGYMDLDLATDLRYLRAALLPLLNDEQDIVTGSRLAPGAKVIGRSTLRNITSYSFNRIVKVVFGTSFTDGMCGFKFLQRKHLSALRENGAISDGWFFATELLVTADYLGYRLLDLPVTWTDDPNSKVKVVKLSLEYLRAMNDLRKRLPARKV